MKLYRLCRGCEGEYSCDNYLGLFKTTDSMISFLENYVKEEYANVENDGFKDFSASLGQEGKFSYVGTGSHEWIFDDIDYETIETDNLI